MKKAIKYIGIYFITLIICVITLVGTSKIPKTAIEKSIKESAEYYKKVDGIERIQRNREYTYLHYYADSMLLSIIYGIDSNNAIKSSLEAKYYEKIYADINDDFIEMVEEEKEANQEYLRYWHGSMVIIRPMLVLFNIEQIYMINTIVMLALILLLMYMLFKRHKALALSFVIGLVMIAIPFVPVCLEYSWTFMIMLITSIIGIKIEKNKSNWVGPLFLITGMLTCFLDFLSTEIVTLFIPMLFIMVIRNKEGRLNTLKDALVFLGKMSLLWGIGYIGMWFAKWCLASIVLGINAFDYVTNQAIYRIGIKSLSHEKKSVFNNITSINRSNVILKNIQGLYPIANFKRYTNNILISTLVVFLIIEFIIVDRKKIKNMWFSIILFIIGIMPYIRYELLLQHSYAHRFFTFRNQIITIICLIMIIVDSYKARKNWIINLENNIKNRKRKKQGE